jgi:hypothetical protein
MRFFAGGRPLFLVMVVIWSCFGTDGHRNKSIATSTTSQTGIVQMKSEITANTTNT